MTCPGCQRPNDPRRRYCGGCGHNLQPVCRRCSFDNLAEDRFCGGCGAVMLADAASSPGARAAPPTAIVGDDVALRATTPARLPGLASVARATPPQPPSKPAAVTPPTRLSPVVAAVRPVPPAAPPSAPVAPVAAMAAVAPPARPAHPEAADAELAGLFAVAPAPSETDALPESGLGQDDLDRLFGVVP